MQFSTYSGSGIEGSDDQTLLLTGAGSGPGKGTVVKTLELITGDASCKAHVIRKDATGVTYGDISVDLKARDYLLLWEGFVFIPAGHRLLFTADSDGFRIIASCIEIQ